MKKLLTVLLCAFIIFSSFVQVSAANSTTDTAMNSAQLSAKRFSAKIRNQSEQETARDIMRSWECLNGKFSPLTKIIWI